MREHGVHRGILFAALLFAVSMLGCGSDDPPGPAPGSGDRKPKPQGELVDDVDDLVGVWFRKTEGPLIGMEFTASGKVILTGGRARGTRIGGSQTLDYVLMEGGRVSMSTPRGRTRILQIKVSSDELYIDPEDAKRESDKQLFRRLEDETLAQALEKEVARMQARDQARLDEVRAMLRDGSHVIVAGDRTFLAFTLDRDDAGALRGTGFRMDPPAQQEVEARISKTAVAIRFGRVVRPAGMAPPAPPSISFRIEGEPGEVKLTGQVHDPATKKLVPATLRREDGELAACKAKLDEAEAKELAETEAFTTLLRRYARLEGECRGIDGKPLAVVLRVARKGPKSYAGGSSNLRLTRKEGKVIGQLHASAQGQKIVAELEPDGSGGLKGMAQVSGRLPTPMSLKVVETMDEAEYEAAGKRVIAVLKNRLRDGLKLRGAVRGGFPQYGQRAAVKQTIPVEMLVYVTEAGVVTGSATYPTLAGRIELSGKLVESGIDSHLHITGAVRRAPQTFAWAARQQMWLYVDAPDPLRFRGVWTTARSPSEILLTPPTAEHRASDRAEIEKHLTEGQTFVARVPVAREPVLVSLKLDPATGAVSGTLGSGHLRPTSLAGPGTFSGTIRETDYACELALKYQHQNKRYAPTDYVFRLFEADGVVLLAGPWIAREQMAFGLQFELASEEQKREARIHAKALELKATNRPVGRKPGDVAILLARGDTRGAVYGSGPYTANSNAIAAAVHAGLLKKGELGLIRIKYSEGLDEYAPSNQNGVQTRATAKYRLSFELEKIEVE
ncbi:MAG: LCCL domain-containing protein [Planctomycetota bacterium]